MPIEQKDQQLLSRDAFLLFNQIGGEIQTRSLAILREQLSQQGKTVASKDDVQRAYREACGKILGQER